MTPARLLYAHAGSPARPDCVGIDPAPCWLCGHTCTRAAERLTWEGGNYTDQNRCRAQASPWVCEACVWACSWTPPPGWMPTRTDAKRTPMLRSYSHLWDAGKYHFVNKAEKPLILAWLRSTKRGPWFATIADSGQKHALPWAPINKTGGERGMIWFEDRPVALPDRTGWDLVDSMIALLTAGATKAELGWGEYRVNAWRTIAGEIHGFEDRWHGKRGSQWWTVALWLAQREETDGRRTSQAGDRTPSVRAA